MVEANSCRHGHRPGVKILSGTGTGTVTVFVSPEYYNPSIQDSLQGTNLTLSGLLVTGNLTVNGSLTVNTLVVTGNITFEGQLVSRGEVRQAAV